MTVILHVVEAFGGGVFASVTQACNGLAMLGYEVHLAYSSRPETPQPVSAYLDPRVTLHPVPMTRNIAPLCDLRALLHLTNLFRKLRPDVIHLHSSKAGFLGRVAAWFVGYEDKVFYSPRGLSFLQQNESGLQRELYRLLEQLGLRFGGTVVTCSRSEFEEVGAHLRSGRIALVENAVDTAIVVPKSTEGGPRCRVGTAGRIAPQKNPEMFLRVIADIAEPNAEFIWIGGGDSSSTMALQQAGVEVTGWLTRERALSELATLDVYVQTSLWEGMPIVVIEAMVAGIPAVVTDVVGNRDVVDHGQTGFIARDQEEMGQYLRQLVMDPSLRRTMGQEARRRALRRFGLERMLAELVALYRVSPSLAGGTAGPENSGTPISDTLAP